MCVLRLILSDGAESSLMVQELWCLEEELLKPDPERMGSDMRMLTANRLIKSLQVTGGRATRCH